MSATYYADSGPLWAITSYYNPNRYWRRRANYTQFRRHLDLPLLAVELNCGGRFELNEDDAEILIRCHSGDVMWQKERLLNIALAALPKNCEYVAWLDCDILLPQADWTTQARRQLDEFALVQPFSKMLHLQPDADLSAPDRGNDALLCRSSLASLLLEGLDPHEYFDLLADKRVPARSPGHAWVARRELLQTHGIYDARIIGGGDSVFASAALGSLEAVILRQKMNEQQAEHYRAWAEPFYDAVHGRVGCLDQTGFHLWHGDIAERRYRERFDDWREFDYDPARDLWCESGGAWHWASAKPGLHALLRDYFVARNEDGAAAQTLKAA